MHGLLWRRKHSLSWSPFCGKTCIPVPTLNVIILSGMKKIEISNSLLNRLESCRHIRTPDHLQTINKSWSHLYHMCNAPNFHASEETKGQFHDSLIRVILSFPQSNITNLLVTRLLQRTCRCGTQCMANVSRHAWCKQTKRKRTKTSRILCSTPTRHHRLVFFSK